MGQLVHWLDYQGIFSIEDNVVEDHTEPWYVAKTHRLVARWVNHPETYVRVGI